MSGSRSQPAELLEARTLLTAAWVSQGPAIILETDGSEGVLNNPSEGAVQAIAAHPTNADILYVGTTNGGIWKTTNARVASPTWTAQTDSQTSLSIGALEIDPADPTHLVAGIGLFSTFSKTGGARTGILSTTNGGSNWTASSGGGVLTGKNISGVAVRGSTIVVSVNDADVAGSSNLGIFRSTDSGATFAQETLAANGIPQGTVLDLVGDPSSSSTLYASVVLSEASGHNGIYKSIDRGANWTEVSNLAMKGLMDAITTSKGNVELAVGTSNNVYCGIVSSTNGQLAAIFRSGDGGAQWTAMDLPTTIEGGVAVGLHPGGQGGFAFSIVADPSNANVVYVGGDASADGIDGNPNSIGTTASVGRLFRGNAAASTGSQWAHLTNSNLLGAVGGGTASNSAPHADSREMVFDAAGNIIEADDGGIWRRTSPRNNTGDWFSAIGTLGNTELHDIAYDSNSHIIIGGAQDNGVAIQAATGGTTWKGIGGGDGGDVAVDDITFAADHESVRYFSSQNLVNFTRQSYDSSNVLIPDSEVLADLTVTGDGAVFVPQFVTPVVLNAVDPTRILFVGQNSAYESLDQGDTITEIPDGDTDIGNDQYAVAYGHPANPDVIFLGYFDDVKVRLTAGGSLATTAAALPGGGDDVVGIVLDSTTATAKTAFVIDKNQVFETTDRGRTWGNLTGNIAALGATSFRSLVFVPGVTGNAIVVGTGSGIYFATSTDYSVWTKLGTSLPNAPVFDMEYDAADDVLVAGTLGRGAFTMPNVVTEMGLNLPVISIAANSGPKLEGNSGLTPFTFTVTRSGDTSGMSSVNFAVTGSSANLATADDFGGTLPSGAVNFAAGETTKTVTVNVTGDTLAEAFEGFRVTLSSPSAGTTLGTAFAAAQIQNDDLTVLSIAGDSGPKAEGNSGLTPFTFTVTRVGLTRGLASVNFAVTGSGANPSTADDFGGTLPSGTVTFASGESSKTLTINVTGDSLVENAEGFRVTLSNPSIGTTLGTGLAGAQILNDDLTVLSITATSATKAEGNSGLTPFTFTVTRVGATNGTASVNYAVVGSSANLATAGDFGGVFPSGTVNFAASETSKVLTINVTADTLVEKSEGFRVILSNPSVGTTLGTGLAAAQIRNDDANVSIVADSGPKPEGNSGLTPYTFTVTRVGDTSGTAIISFAVTGSSTNLATAADFGGTFPSGTVSFAAGETTKILTINVIGDTVVERSEGFRVTLSNPSVGTTLVTTIAAAQIQNDDVLSLLSSNSPVLARVFSQLPNWIDSI